MDWKPWYRADVEGRRGREAVMAALARRPDGDAFVRAALAEGGAVSFPHTRLEGSAGLLARVATSIVAEGSERVVALGVLHGSTLPEPARALAAAASRGDTAVLAEVGGAFVDDDGEVTTPFGAVPAGPSPALGPWVRRRPALLAHEFSLDLFLAVLAAAAGPSGPPPVTRVFVGPVAPDDPTSPIADAIAAAIRPLLGPRVALVATGDLVHAGNGYAPASEVASLPEGREDLRAHFDLAVRSLLEAGVPRRIAADEFDRRSRALRSDQRHVAPVLFRLLPPRAPARVLSFDLTDYGDVLGVPPPCVVASALVAWTPSA